MRPLEFETLVVAMAPHIDQPLGQLFTLIRGETTRRGVDLALVGLLYRLSRADRVALLDAVDPERPLLAWRLLQIASPKSVDAYVSVSSRALQPTLDMLSVAPGADSSRLPYSGQRV